MGLNPGARLGAYEIVGLIGAGGMGEVYRARDTKLNREVAIKVLPQVFAVDAEARFEREAQLLASLNHPNIAHVHGLEESNGTRAIAMELVEGDDLAQRLGRGPLPVSEALSIAKQIADALEAAHDLGIIHRDLKPANIKVRDDGTVKVLDFGLAKALDSGSPSTLNVADSPTLTLHATRAGLILGTAAYMSPEQAHGRAADRRADIFAFGAVVFEMLTGKQAFRGESVSDTLAAVLKVEPDWSVLPADVPAHVRTLLRRCLTKDRAQRLQAIGEARIVLTQPALVEPLRTAARNAPSPATWILAAALAIVTTVVAWSWLRPTQTPARSILRFADATTVAGVPGAVAISRDGTRLAFVGGARQEIYVRLLGQLAPVPIPKTENAALLCFSRDGLWISYVIYGNSSQYPQGQLMRVSADGGPPQKLADVATRVGPPTQSWSDDGTILFNSAGALWRIPERGGTAETLAEPDRQKNEQYFAAPQLLPGGQNVLVNVNVGPNAYRVLALDMRSRQKKVLLETVGLTRFIPSEPGSRHGHLVSYGATAGTLNAVAFDAGRLALAGTLIPVLDGIRGSPAPFGQFAVSDTGTLAYVPGGSAVAAERTLVWVDRQGTEQPTGAPAHPYNLPRLSADGGRVAVEIQGSGEVRVYDLARRILSPTGNAGLSPVWMPDGERLVYVSALGGPTAALAVAPVDRSGAPIVFAEGTNAILPSSVAPDGQNLIGTSRQLGSGESVILVPLTGAAERPRLLFTSPFLKASPVFSPDGRWIAYTSTDSGRSDVFVSAYPGPGATKQASNEGGTQPRWSRDGRELFYRNGGKMMAVKVELTPTFRADRPQQLFENTYGNGYDVAPDGKRFLMVKNLSVASAGEVNQLNVVVNWSEELKQRMPTR